MANRQNVGDGSGELHLQGDLTTLMHLSSGEETVARQFAGASAITAATQVLLLTFWVCRKAQVTTQATLRTGSTAAGATPTLARLGLYEVSAAGDGALVASTVNDTALFAASFTAYTKSWAAAYTMKPGQRYAFGILTVSAAAMPSFQGATTGASFSSNDPRLHGTLAAQADLPATFTAGSLGNAANSGQVLGIILP